MTTESNAPTYGKYLVIWVWLIVLLLAGSFVPSLRLSQEGAATLILGVALVKTTLVALFYMHLKFEKWVPIWVVAGFPFLLIGLAVGLLKVGFLFV